ncbi:hypothetical protein GOODEAATRI_032652, partial [Goodea atripinnis]
KLLSTHPHRHSSCNIVHILFPSICRYDTIKDVITGLGSFQVTVQLMNGIEPLPHNYSLSPEQAVVVEISLNTTSKQIRVVLDKCWATPTQNPEDTYSYTFLDNRSATAASQSLFPSTVGDHLLFPSL